MTTDPYVPAHVVADEYDRITVPLYLSRCLHWMQGADSFSAWLLLIAAGRYRLLSDEEVAGHPQLEPIRSIILEGKPPVASEPTSANSSSEASKAARLVPAKIAPFKTGWRISFPEALRVFCPRDCDPRAFSILISLQGYLELWYTDVLRREASLPLDSSLR
jgi:hypothetical protein